MQGRVTVSISPCNIVTRSRWGDCLDISLKYINANICICINTCNEFQKENRGTKRVIIQKQVREGKTVSSSSYQEVNRYCLKLINQLLK